MSILAWNSWRICQAENKSEVHTLTIKENRRLITKISSSLTKPKATESEVEGTHSLLGGPYWWEVNFVPRTW